MTRATTATGAVFLLINVALGAEGELAPVGVSYQLPADGSLPKTYRVTLAITAADNPDWIVSQFAAGVARTVTEENQGRFTETWNGLDDNFMPVPPGEYGVKGIYMPAEVWAPDGQPHTLRTKLHGGPFALTPKPGAGENGPFIEGDPVGQGMGDVDVGPDGVAVFYWQFLENGRNPYPVDLTRPLGPGQLHSGFGSGGTGGGNHVATDGKTVWAVAPDDDLVRTNAGEAAFLYPPFLFRADEKPFGRDDMIRRNVTPTAGRVTGLAAWRPKQSGPAWLFVAERGKMVLVGKHAHGPELNIVPEPHGIHGSIHVTQPMFGLIGMIDQTRAGVHVYDWESGLFVDTLMLTTGGRNHEAASVYDSPGEFFSGGAHEAGGKVYLRWGKTSPLLFEIEGWTARHGIRPVTGLPEKVGITAAQIASPPELASQIRGGAGAAKVAAFQPLPGAGPALDGSRAGWEGCAPVVFGDDAARIEVRCGYNPETLFLRWEVRAAQATAVPPLPSPERIFTHDRVATTLGFYLQGDAAAQGKASEGRPGDMRIVFGLHDDNGQIRPAALGLYPSWDRPGEARPFLYISPGQRTSFAHVALLDAVKLAHTLSDDRKTLVVTAAIPRSVLPGTVPGLADGWRSMANFDANIGGSHKLWWSNADGSASRETKDEPTEARLYPGAWGQAAFTPLSGGLPVRAWLVNGPWRSEALKYTGTSENKRQFQEHFDAATFPPDSRAIGSGDIAAQPPAKPGQWRVLNARPIDNCLYPDDGHGLHTRGCNLYFAANWIWAPETMEVTLELPMQHQNNLSVWLNGTRLAETAREQGLYRTVTTPQKITLQAGWNQLFLRAYALGYDLHFGTVLKADAGQLWRLRLSAALQEPGTKN